LALIIAMDAEKEDSFKDNLETKYWYFYALNFGLQKKTA
jgi:hypothetical protein